MVTFASMELWGSRGMSVCGCTRAAMRVLRLRFVGGGGPAAVAARIGIASPLTSRRLLLLPLLLLLRLLPLLLLLLMLLLLLLPLTLPPLLSLPGVAPWCLV